MATILIAIVCVLLIAFVALGTLMYLRKEPVCEFLAAESVDVSSYMAAMIVAAEKAGFRKVGCGEHAKTGKSIVATLMVSPDFMTFALISSGATHDRQNNKTRLYSMLDDVGVEVTTDHAMSTDLDPKSFRRALVNATFGELYNLHEDSPPQRKPFPENISWVSLHRIWRRQAERTVNAGVAVYAGPDRQFVHLTFRGVLACIAYANAIGIDASIRERKKLAQPNSCCPKCGYDIRITPDRCPECGHEVKLDRPD